MSFQLDFVNFVNGTSAPRRPIHGSSPYENNSHNVTPKDHTSEARENCRYLRDSGGHLKEYILQKINKNNDIHCKIK